jgi:uncharacterized protein YndB with AHSA1/START domain
MAGNVSMWGTYGDRPEPLAAHRELFAALEVRASVDVECPPAAAWALITDIGRIAEFSPECAGARWLDRAAAPGVGARFEGTNRVGDGDAAYTWIRPCTVTAYDPERVFAYEVGDRYDGTAASTWTFVIEPTGPGSCRIRQTFRHAPDGLSGLREIADSDRAQAEAIVRLRAADLQAGMTKTLQVMKSVLQAEAESPAAGHA